MSEVIFNVNYGKGKLKFSIPENNLIGVLRTSETEKLTDVEKNVRIALENPIGTKPLREIVQSGEKVVIVINDITRVMGTDQFLPVIINYLNENGIPDDNITLLVATGLHRAHTKDEHKYIIGDELYKRVKIVDHIGTDMENTDYIGTTKAGTEVYVNKLVTQADKVILTGEVTYHMAAGYTGGRKSVLPGVCNEKTINQNHLFMLDERARSGQFENNPLHLDMLEAAQMLNPDFIFNVVLDKDRDFVYMVGGDVEQAHKKGRDLVDKLFAAQINELADVVIANCGGYPKDIEFYQSQKTLDNAIRAVKEGGTVILLAACTEGVGSKLFHDIMKNHSTPEEAMKFSKENFRIGIHKAFLTSRLLAKAETILISELTDETVKELMMRPAHSVEEALDYVRRKHGGDFTMYAMPEGFLTVPFYKK
ncbi:MAG: hypothetical protein VR72_16810 [Clostridiaceae bacterium BRH_c20a]|nr:MAG: hypothetical protein VR72_16810 [Clostridiaceae bacterium BRH_c20a]